MEQLVLYVLLEVSVQQIVLLINNVLVELTMIR
jgi:hypothetical protein